LQFLAGSGAAATKPTHTRLVCVFSDRTGVDRGASYAAGPSWPARPRANQSSRPPDGGPAVLPIPKPVPSWDRAWKPLPPTQQESLPMKQERMTQRQSLPDLTTTPAHACGGDSPDQCRDRGTTLGEADPKTMTAPQRSHEVAAILAVGLLRRHAYAALPAAPGPDPASGQQPDSAQDCLELPGETVLSVHRGSRLPRPGDRRVPCT
jgi:hypothetical protein